MTCDGNLSQGFSNYTKNKTIGDINRSLRGASKARRSGVVPCFGALSNDNYLSFGGYFLYVRTYEPQAEIQVHHGDEPLSEVNLLYGALPTANQHSDSHPPSVMPRQTIVQQKRNKSGHYSPGMAANNRYHALSTAPTPRVQ